MKNKQLVIGLIAVIIVGGIGFFGGTIYAKGSAGMRGGARMGANGFAARGNMMGGVGGGVGGGQGRGGMLAGFTAGEVSAKDDKSITLKLRDGGSKIVFFGASTTVLTLSQGSLEDVTNGAQVTVSGSTNSDGSLTATSIQLRPEGMGFAGFGGMGGGMLR